MALKHPEQARSRRRWRRFGRALYLLLVQSLVGLAAIALGLYLALNSPSFAPYLGHAVSAALPGEVRLHWLRFGPSPGHLELRHVVVRAPDGHQVMSARRLELEWDVVRLLQSLLTGGERVLRIERLEIDGAEVWLDEDVRGRLRLPLAFSDPDEPPKADGKPMRVMLTQAKLTDLGVHIAQAHLRAEAREVHLSGGLDVLNRPGTPPQVHWSLHQIAVPYLEAAPTPMADLPPLPPMAMRARDLEGGPDHMQLRDVSVVAPVVAGDVFQQPLPDFAVDHMDLDVQLEPEMVVLGQHARMQASTRNRFLGALLGRDFDGVATLEGDFRQSDQGFRCQAQVEAGGKLAGFEVDKLRGRIDVAANVPGELPVRVAAQDLDVRAYGGALRSPLLTYRMAPGTPQVPVHFVDTHLHVEQFDAEAALKSEAVALSGPAPGWLAGRLSGDLALAVRSRLDPSRQPKVASEVALLADLQLDRGGGRFADVLPEVQAHGAVGVAMGPDRPLQLDLGQLLVHTGPDPEDLNGREWLRADGRVEFAGDDTDLTVSADVPHLRHLLAPAGIEDLDGELGLSETRIHGAVGEPGVEGALRVRHLTARGHEIKSLQSRLRVAGGELSLLGLQAETDLATVRADVHLGLGARKRLRVDRLRIDQIDLAHDLKILGMREVSGHAGLLHGQLALDLADWQHTLEVDGDLWGDEVVVWGNRLPEVAAHLSAHGQVVRLDDGDVRLWNDQLATLKGQYHIDSGHFAGHLVLPPVALDGVRALADLPVRGSIAGQLSVEGDRHGLALDSRLEVRGLAWDQIHLGDADLHIDKRRDSAARFSAERFFPRFRLLDGSEARFAGLQLQQAELRIASDGRLDPFAVLGMERPAGMTASLEASTTTVLDFRPGHPRYAVAATFEPGGLDVDLGAQQGLRNTSPVAVRVTPAGIELDSAFLELGREQLELCGTMVLPGDGQPPEVALFAAGSVDVPRVGVLAQTVAVLDMRIDLENSAPVDRDPRSACLASGRSRGRLRIEGPLDAVRVDGILRARASHITPRRFGHEIGIAAGGRMVLASAGDALTVSIPRDSTLTGTFDDGRWAAWGEATLDRLQPEKVDLFMSGTEIPWSAPKEYAVTVSPDLVFRGRQLTDPAKRTMTLQGNADVKDGSYYRNFDKLGGIIGNAGERQVDAVSKPLQETWPWLREVDLNLDVRGVDFEFNSKFVALKFDLVLDMDLNVRGSMFEPRVYKRVRVKDGSGSQVHYALNHIDFDVVRGNLDFQGDPAKPYLDLLLKADIPVRTASVATRAQLGVGADLQDATSQQSDVVTIFVTVEGVYGTPSFKLGFSSNQGDSESDVQYILLTGHRRTDATGAGPQIGISALVGVSAQDLVSRLLGKDVLDVNTEYDPTSNAVAAEVSKRLGKQITLAVKALSGREQQRYSAQFQFRLNDLLSFNGLWRRQQFTVGGLAEQPVDVYDFKLRYRMPLE